MKPFREPDEAIGCLDATTAATIVAASADVALVLDRDGVLAMEIGFDEAKATSELFRSAGYRDVGVARDYAGVERVVSGVRPVSR